MDIKKHIENIIKTVDPDREDLLRSTPSRVANAYDEFFDGHHCDIAEISGQLYDSEMDEIIMLKNIPFESHCEHHLLPIVGIITVGYIPNGKIIGASKLARVVDCFAHRLQLQERLTMEIATAIDLILKPEGVAVHVCAEHFCISHRGVKKHGSSFVTKYFIGSIKNNPEFRREFLSEIK